MKKLLTTLFIVFALSTCLFTLSACELELNHVHSYTTQVVEPTCTEQGYTTYVCECGDTYKVYVNALGHSFTNYVSDNNATYEADGTKTAKCDNCNQTDTIIDEGSKLISSQGLEYELNSDGQSYCVMGIGTCEDTNIVIPSIYENKPVTSIGERAFASCRITNIIIIPNSVTSIGNQAFSYCGNLTSIEIPNNVTSIGEGAFLGCESLTNINVDENNTVYKDIDGNLYSKDGKRLIQYAVGKSQTSFTIPNGVESIGIGAFAGYRSLTTIEIPNSVTSIVDGALVHCPDLTNINVDENNTMYKDIDGNLYSKDGKILIQYAIGKTQTSFTIPNSVTSIGEHAFHGCSNLTSVIIGNSVESIGIQAFTFCDNLTSITIDNSVTSIGIEAFYYCVNLTSVTIGNSVTSIGYGAFDHCYSLTIYCEAESKPSGWHSRWNDSGCPVVWNCNNNEIAEDGCIYAIILLSGYYYDRNYFYERNSL